LIKTFVDVKDEDKSNRLGLVKTRN